MARGTRSRVVGLIVGPPVARRLTLTHAIDDIADAMVNLSLVGSLFFSVSLDASRNRIMLYLLMTALPLAIAAPIIGPALDRSRLGYRFAIAGTQLVRAVVSVALIGSLLSVTLYPLAFTVLICRKVYGLAKTTLLTRMTDDRAEFLVADAHITRAGTIFGGLGVVVGGILLARDATTLMLIIGAVLFVLAALVSRRLPTPRPTVVLPSMPQLREIVPSPVWRATLAVTAIRAAAGALVYLLAFAIKRGGGDQWIFAAGLLVAGAGAMVATFVSPRLHRSVDPDGVLVLALLVPGVVSGLGVPTIGNVGVLVVAFAIGLGNGLASRSIAVLQSAVPAIARGRTIARSELLFQLATLVGAALAVQLAPSPGPGFAVAGAVLVIAGAVYARDTRTSLRRQASRLLAGEHAPGIHDTLPRALLAEAGRLASLGANRMAVVVAAEAVQISRHRGADAEPGTVDTWLELAEHIENVRSRDEQPPDDVVIEVLAEATRHLDGAHEQHGFIRRHRSAP